MNNSISVGNKGKRILSHLIIYMQNTDRVDPLLCTFGLECEVANHIVYRPDSIVYQLINFFGSVELRTAQVACNFVYFSRKILIYFEGAILHSLAGSALLRIQPIFVADR